MPIVLPTTLCRGCQDAQAMLPALYCDDCLEDRGEPRQGFHKVSPSQLKRQNEEGKHRVGELKLKVPLW